jgi:hypothetical protein
MNLRMSIKVYSKLMLKKLKMDTKDEAYTESQMNTITKNLLLDVPKELLNRYFQFLDVKSSIMFVNTCQKVNESKYNIKNRENATLSSILKKVSFLLNKIHYLVSNAQEQNKLMANILRKSIFSSVLGLQNNVVNCSPFAIQQCVTEYNHLQQYIAEEMDIDWYVFNELLENSQFEFRGFEILNLSDTVRNRLDTFKDLIKKYYFNGIFTIHAYLSYDNIFFEIDCEDNDILLDVHYTNDEGKWIFLYDLIHKDNDMVEKLSKAGVYVDRNMIKWNKNDTNACEKIASVILKVMYNVNYLQGTSDITLQVWNENIENSWGLNEVTQELIASNRFETQLSDITFEAVDEFNYHKANQH